MNKQAISDALRALARGDTERSKAARLREVIDDVESALAAGVSRTAVLRVLAEQGLEMSLPTFDTAMKRIRQQRRREVAPTTRSPDVASRAPVASNTESDGLKMGSHNPAALDEIIGSQPDLAALAKLAKRKRK